MLRDDKGRFISPQNTNPYDYEFFKNRISSTMPVKAQKLTLFQRIVKFIAKWLKLG